MDRGGVIKFYYIRKKIIYMVMKSLKSILMTLFVSVVLSSCSNFGNGGASVVGTWSMDMEDMEEKIKEKNADAKMLPGTFCEYVFNEDGTGMEKAVTISEIPYKKEGLKIKNTMKASNPFRWRKDGSRLVVEITDMDVDCNFEPISDNPKVRAEWQVGSKKWTDDINSERVKAVALAKVNSGGGYDFEILELSENRLELKPANGGDVKKFNKVK